MRRSILTEKLARRGQHIAREYSVDFFELMRVADVMDRNALVLPGTVLLTRYAAQLAKGDVLVCRHQGTLLGDEDGELAGIITRGDVVRALEEVGNSSMTVAEAGSRDVIVTYPDETLHDAITKLLRHDIGRLAVVERTSPRKVVGYLGRASILSALQRYHREENVRERGAKIRGANHETIGSVQT
jgi:CBS domain-containing protein